MARRWWVSAAVTACLSLTLVLSSCQSPVALHVAYMPWVGYESLSLADEMDWLPDNVILHRTNSSLAAVDMLRDGTAQVAAITLDQALQARQELEKLKVVLVMDESAGADMVISRRGYPSLQSLRGARIGYRVGDVSELLLNSMLREAGMNADDVILVDLPVAELGNAWAAKAVDAVVGYPPYTDSVLADGGQVIYDSRSIPATILDVLVVNGDALLNREEALAATIAAHFRALEYLRVNREDAVYRYAAYQNSTSSEIRAALAGVRLPALEGVRAYLQSGGAVQRAAQRLIDEGLVPGEGRVSADFVDARYLPSPSP